MGAFFMPIVSLANTILDRVLPDKAAQDAAKLQLATMQLNGELAQLAGQLEVNKTEAASQSTFVAGWRPFIGWVGGCGLAYEMILRPLLTWASMLFGHPIVAPNIEIQDLMALVGTMLGMGVMRTVDKAQGTGNGH